MMSDVSHQPDWIWYDNESQVVSFGRWHKVPEQAKYLREDQVSDVIGALGRVIDALKSDLATARADALEEAAKLADAYADENITMAGDAVLFDPVLRKKPGHTLSAEEWQKSQDLITDGCVHSSMFHAAQNISTAIRALITPTKGGE